MAKVNWSTSTTYTPWGLLSLRVNYWFFEGRHESKIRGSKIAVRISTRAYWCAAQLFCKILRITRAHFLFYDRVVVPEKKSYHGVHKTTAIPRILNTPVLSNHLPLLWLTIVVELFSYKSLYFTFIFDLYHFFRDFYFWPNMTLTAKVLYSVGYPIDIFISL